MRQRVAVLVGIVMLWSVVPGGGNLYELCRTPYNARLPYPASQRAPFGSVFAASLPLPAILPRGVVEIHDAAGHIRYTFKAETAYSITFSDKDHPLCTLTSHDGRLKASSPGGQALFELKKKEAKVMLKDASGDKELGKFKLKGQEVDFYTTDERRLYRLKSKDDGARLENNAGETMFRTKQKEGKMVLRDGQDKTVLSSPDLQYPLGLLFFRIPKLSLEQQAACFLFFLQER